MLMSVSDELNTRVSSHARYKHTFQAQTQNRVLSSCSRIWSNANPNLRVADPRITISYKKNNTTRLWPPHNAWPTYNKKTKLYVYDLLITPDQLTKKKQHYTYMTSS